MATFRYHTILNNAYAKGIPIIQEKVVAERWQKPVDAVRKYLKAGYSLGEACIKAKVPEEDYRYSLGRVREGDYKTFKIFTHIFWDGDLSSEDKFTIPEMEKIDIKERSIGFMVNGKVRKEEDYKLKLFGNEENLVVVMTEKPIRVKQMKLKEFLEKK